MITDLIKWLEDDELFWETWTTMTGGVEKAARLYEPEALGALEVYGSRKRIGAGALGGNETVTGHGSGGVAVDNASGLSIIT